MKPLYTFLLIITCILSYSQDLITLRDSSKIKAKLIEVNQTEIRYKFFEYQSGPDIIRSKNEIAYIIYQNGFKDVFKDPVKINTTVTNSNDTIIFHQYVKPKRDLKIGDYIKFNIQIGVVANNSYCNIRRVDLPPSRTSEEEYSPTNNKKYNYNFNIGFNFLFGYSPYIKHIVGVNYLRSKGEFNYHYAFYYKTYHSKDFQYVSKLDFINLITGLQFRITKRIHIEPLIAFNYLASADIRYSGTEIISDGYYREVTYHNNKKLDNYERTGISHTISLCPRIRYELDFTNEKLELYASYNHAFGYRLPWWMIGITYYPFKKLR